MRNLTAREKVLDEDKQRENERREHVFDGEDANALTHAAGAAAAARERKAAREERAYASASSARKAARVQAAAAREQGLAAAETEEAEEDRHLRAFTQRDKTAADAAAEKEASAEETKWKERVARYGRASHNPKPQTPSLPIERASGAARR
jgi:hypothetical protein